MGRYTLDTHEHSDDTPLFKGAQVRCYKVTDGTPIWTMDGWANPHTVQVADGVLTGTTMAHKFTQSAKEPTAMTVTAPDTTAALGASVTIKGAITDVSAGTKQDDQAARFQQGVPAVSDAV
jgi:hypothetical protein